MRCESLPRIRHLFQLVRDDGHLQLNPFRNLYRADSITTSLGATLLASVGSRAIGLIRGIALAWLIPIGEFGLFGVAQLVANVLLPLCSVGLYEGVARYAPLHESARTLVRFTRRVCLLVLAVSLPATVALYLLAEPVGSVLFSNAQLAAGVTSESEAPVGVVGLTRSVLACVLALVAYQTLLGLLKGLRMFRALAAAELLSAILFTVLAIVGALAGYRSASALMVVYAVSCVVPILLIAPGVSLNIGDVQPGPRAVRRTPKISLVTYSGWAATTAVLWHALSYYPMWYLLKVSDSDTVGTFHAMRIITQLIQVAAAMLIAVLAANITRLWEHEGSTAAVPRLAALTKAAFLSLLVGATVLSLAQPIMMRAFPSTFAEGSKAYDPLVLFFLLVGVVGLIAIPLNLLEQPLRVSVAWLGGALVNVIVSYLLLDSIGSSHGLNALQLAAWAGVAGVTTALFLCIVFTHRGMLGLDRPALLLIAACFSIGFGWRVGLPVVVVTLIVALATNTLFSKRDRHELRTGLAPSGDR